MKNLLAVALVVTTWCVAIAQRNIAAYQTVTALQAVGDKIYFSASHDQLGVELFVSDITGENRSLLKDINPGYSSSTPTEFTIFNNQLFFIAYAPEYGGSVWKTDGTPQGTQLVYGAKGADPSGLMVFKDKLYFSTNLGSIVRTDGTTAGNQIFFQLPGNYGRIQAIKKDSQYIYFTVDGRTIYRDNGTSRISFLAPLSFEDVYFNNIFPVGNSLVVIKASTYESVIRIYAIDNSVVHDHGEDEWTLIKKLDAPIYGTQEIENFTTIGGKLFFNFKSYSDNVAPSDELWICDGTEAGTKMLKAFSWTPYTAYSDIAMFFEFHGKLFFRAGETARQAIWTSDGTAAGTVKFNDATIASYNNDPRLPVLVTDDKFYFSGGDAYNAELWYSDGTTQNTKQLLDIEDDGPSWPHDLCASNGLVYFMTSKQFLSTIWSTSPSPDISVWAGGSVAVASGSTPYLFNDTPKGGCQTVDLKILNKGLSALYLNGLYITGRDFYVVKQNLPESLAPGASVTLKIVFNPFTNGKSNATLTILSNDLDETRYVVNLQGKSSSATAAQICQFSQNEYLKTLEPGQTASSIVLSNATITENQPVGTAIGKLFIDNGATFKLSAGEGDDDNGKFYVEADQLKSNAVFDYDGRTLYTVRVKATTTKGEVESAFRIHVVNISLASGAADCQPGFRPMSFSYSGLDANAAGHLFATTSLGQVIRSTDGGQNWEIVYEGDPYDLPTITFKGSSGYVAGNTVFLKSDDSGATWSRLYLPTKALYYFGPHTMSFLGDNEGYVGTDQGEIFYTADGGHSWETRSESTSWQFRNLFFRTRDKGYAVSGFGDLLQTVDGGRTWSSMNLSSLAWDTRVRDIYFVSDAKGFLTTDYYVYQTTDGGKSWSQLSIGNGGYYGRFKFFNESLGFMYGGEGFLYKTTNGGDTWDIVYPNGAAGRAVGIVRTSGKIFMATKTTYSSYQTGRSMVSSSDDGTTWSNLDYYADANISNIEFYGEGKGVILNAFGFFRTQNNGMTWKQETPDIPGVADIVFTDDHTALIVSGGNIYKSTDGGLTTRLVLKTDDNPTYLPAGKLYLVPGNTLYAVSWYAVYRSADLGETWSLVSTAVDYYTQGLHFISSSIGFRTELFGSVQKTADGGHTWTNIFTRDPSASIVFNAIFYLDENLGYKGGDVLQRTTDGGYTWETVKWPFYQISAIHFDNPSHGYVVTRGGGVYESKDAGATWQTIFTAPAGIGDVQFFDDTIYLSGENGFSARLDKKQRTPYLPGYIYGPDRICAGDAVDFRVAVESNYRTLWTTTGGNVEDRREYITVKFPSPGDYTLTAKYVNTCGTSEVRTRTVKVSGPPSAPSIDGPDTAGKGQQHIAYTLASAVDNSTYLWSVEGGTSTLDGSQSLFVDWSSTLNNGKISVLEIDPSGCRAYGSLVVKLESPLAVESYLDKATSIYPNPAESDTRISSTIAGTLTIRILDVTGREHSRYTVSGDADQYLQTKNLPSGLYMIEITDGKQYVTKKLIKK